MSSRQTLRKGSKGKSVSELQKVLNKVLSLKPPMKVDGDFGAKTRLIVLQFQKQAKIKADGVVGKGTWQALAAASVKVKPSTLPQFLLADIAKTYLGVKETGDNLAGTSKEMLEIFNADDLTIGGKTDGYPWCAAFVSLCVQKLCKQSAFYGVLTPPREPSVRRFLDVWAKQQHCMIFKPSDKFLAPVKGDIVVFTFSHIGIVESYNGSTVTTIEGNTNAAGSREGVTVARKHRSMSIIKSFIRLPMSTIGIDKQIDEFAHYC